MKKLHYAWINVFVCCGVLFATGSFMLTLGVFMPQMSGSLNISITAISMVFSVQSGVQVFSAPITARLFSRYNMRCLVPFLLLLLAMAILLFSFAANIITLYIAGALAGFCAGAFTFMLCPIIVKKWFDSTVALVISSIITFFSLGGVVFSPIANAIIEHSSWQTAYRILAVFVAVIAAIAIIFLRDNPQSMGLTRFHIENKDKTAVDKSIAGGAELTEKSSWRSPVFYFAAMYLISMQFVVAFQMHLVNFTMNIGYTAAAGAIVASICSLGGIPSKLSLGFVNMKIGVENSSIIYNSIGLLGIGCLFFLAPKSEIALYIAALFFGFYIQSTLVQSPTLSYNLFGGSKDYSKIYGNIVFLSGCICVGSTALVGYIFDSTGSYNIVLIMVTFLNVLSMLLANILLRKQLSGVLGKRKAISQENV